MKTKNNKNTNTQSHINGVDLFQTSEVRTKINDVNYLGYCFVNPYAKYIELIIENESTKKCYKIKSIGMDFFHSTLRGLYKIDKTMANIAGLMAIECNFYKFQNISEIT